MEIPTVKSAEQILYEAGVFDGRKGLARQIAVDLDAITDEDGSLSGGDCVEYIYQMLERLGTVTTCDRCMSDHAVGPCPRCDIPLEIELSSTIDIIDGKLTGPTDELLLLARTIHDVIEGADRDANA